MNQQELINAYLEGKLSAEDRALFEKLIDETPSYRTELEFQRRKTAGAELNSRISPNHPTQTKAKLKSWIISASIACALVLAGYLLWATLGMNPGEKLYTKYYEPYLNQISESAYGADAVGLKSEAFEAYDAKDFKKAADLFQQLEPDSDYILFYLGICQLELGRPEKAIPLLSRVSGTESVSKEVASWYEALGYFQMNMLDKSIAPLEITAATSNPYQEEAKEVLKTLENTKAKY